METQYRIIINDTDPTHATFEVSRDGVISTYHIESFKEKSNITRKTIHLKIKATQT